MYISGLLLTTTIERDCKAMGPKATTQALYVEGQVPSRSLTLSPILVIKTSFKSTRLLPDIHDLPTTDDLDENIESIQRRMESMKLAPPAPALRSHVELPDDEEISVHAEMRGSADEVISPLDLDLQRGFSLPFGKPSSGLSGTPMIITESHQGTNMLVEEPESYTEPSLLLEGVSTDQIKPSAMHLFAREHNEVIKGGGSSDHAMDTTSGT
ncbi:hypothetical protein D9619_001269 [Psilocybe cf. subviscida]|uniref:Uncharacterized protein n=1 Tax=Psilocybe cf. subviscida TaxID=2480587 RepID=A0A8H5BGH7_9AGAR|nr:hypothetical protein D9619_001269 [Psilocybe cf. subviscida]